jgi:hypothetical protein
MAKTPAWLACVFGVLVVFLASLARGDDAPAAPAGVTAQVVHTVRSSNEGIPKDWGFFTTGLAVVGDYVYTGGNGAIHYLKRDVVTGKLTYAGTEPYALEKTNMSMCSAGGRLYSLGAGGTKKSHVLICYAPDPNTGKPVEKSRLEGVVDDGDHFGSLVVSPDENSLYISNNCGGQKVVWIALEADGTPVKKGDAAGRGIGWYNLRLSPDGRFLYSALAPDHAIACIERKPTGEIAYKATTSLDVVTPRHKEPWHYHPVTISGISPDGKWLFVSLWNHDEPIIATFKRDPETGGLTFHEKGSGWDSTRPDFRIANYRDLNLVFTPDGAGGILGNSVGVAQTFRFDTQTGRLSDFADLPEVQAQCMSCGNMVLDAKNNLVYGGGPGWVQNNGVWVAKLSKGTSGGNRSDVKASVASAADAKPGNDIDWPCWRGPNGDGKNPTKSIRKDWAGGLKKVWEVTGLSQITCTWSSLSVRGNKLVVMGRHGIIDEVFCFDADKGGPPIWIAEFATVDGSDYGWGDGPKTTPTIDGDKVYVCSGSGQYACLSLIDGKILWKKAVGTACHGYGNSSLVWDDLLIVPGGLRKDNKPSMLAAFKKDTGELVWSYGETHCGENSDSGHVTPLRTKINGKEQIVYYTGTVVCGLDHLTGQPIWEFTPPKDFQAYCTACTPVTDGAIVYATGIGFMVHPKGIGPMAVQVAEDNTAKELWARHDNEKNTFFFAHHSDAILRDGFLYTFTTHDRGAYTGDLRCVDLKTGLSRWVDKSYGNGSLLEVDGCLLCLTYAGDLLLVDPSPDGFKRITEWKGAVPHTSPWMHHGNPYAKHSAPCWSIPVLAHGKLYIHYSDTLTCYDLMGDSRPPAKP